MAKLYESVKTDNGKMFPLVSSGIKLVKSGVELSIDLKQCKFTVDDIRESIKATTKFQICSRSEDVVDEYNSYEFVKLRDDGYKVWTIVLKLI